MTGPTQPDLTVLSPALAGVVMRVCELVAAAGGRAWLVGGTVRDTSLGRDPGDADLEVFGLAAEDLRSTLAAEFALDLVGRSFGILKLKDWPVDVGLPRRESKIGLGHRGFTVASDPRLPLPEAAARRDFTINAIYHDPLVDEVRDPWDGLIDLANRRLRHTSASFGEDPLRVLRGMQLTARFALTPDPETVGVCRGMELEGLPRERIFGEWRKLMTRGGEISRGLTFLRDTGWLEHYPELVALVGCPQDPRWHPEGDVWVHTLHALDVFAGDLSGDEWEDLVVGFGVLCHDLGKPDTTVARGQRLTTLGHEARSVELTRTFLTRLTDQRRLAEEVIPLVREHMRPTAFHGAGASDAAVRRLARRTGRIDRLVRVARADAWGRPPLPRDTYPAGDWLLAAAQRLAVTGGPPAQLVQGRHLIALGRVPGPEFKDLLDRCYTAQLDGIFDTVDEGVAYLEGLLSR